MDKFRNKNILIIGSPGSGKTTVSKEFEKFNFAVIHTDDYRKYGFEKSLYVLLEDLLKLDNLQNYIIEGILGYRLLRKGNELKVYYPDIVIELDTDILIIKKRYEENRKEKEFNRVMGMIKANQTVLNDYFNNIIKKPEWIKIHNWNDIIDDKGK